MIAVTYSYWDGTGHRRTTTVKKGTTIDKFLEIVRQEFKELRGTGINDLLFVKEDIIIPHVCYLIILKIWNNEILIMMINSIIVFMN